MSRLRGQKWQRHRDSRMADVTAPPTVYQPQLVWVGPLPTSGASRTFPSCHPRLLLLCFLEKQRYRDDLSQPVQQAPKIPDADLRGIRNLGFPGSDGVMEEKAYGHIPHRPAQSRKASCVGALPVGRSLAFTGVCSSISVQTAVTMSGSQSPSYCALTPVL